MRSIERRLFDLEKKLKPLEENKFQKKMREVLGKYRAPTREEFYEAITHKNGLEFIDNKWVREILAMGGKEDLLECIDLIEEFIEEERRKMS
jgi:hypothetical protein